MYLQELWLSLGMLGMIGLTSAMKPGEATACCDASGPVCSSLNLSCQQDKIFIISAEYGNTPTNSNCRCSQSNCRSRRGCCREDNDACFTSFNDEEFSTLFHSCWNKTICRHDAVPVKGSRPLCGSGFHPDPSFLRVKYLCLEEDEIHDFFAEETCESKDLVLYFRSRPRAVSPANDVIRTCDITEENGWPQQVNVIRVFTHQQIFINTPPCGEDRVSNNSKVAFSNDTFTTPFNVSIRVGQVDFTSEGWIVLSSGGNRKLTVTCRSIDFDPTLCPVTSTTATTTASTASPGTPEVETNPSSETTAAVGGFSPRSGGETGSVEEEEEEDATGGVVGPAVGGVVGGVAVVALLAVGVYCYLHRKSAASNQDVKALVAERSSVSMATSRDGLGAGVCNRALHPEGENHYEEIKDGQLTSLYHTVNDDVRGDVTGTETADTDYNRLGGKQTQTGNGGQSNAYSHLSQLTSDAIRPEATGVSNYDHLAKGSHVTSNNINAYSDAPDPAVTSDSSSGGAYNVISFQRQQPDVITGADYDVAKPVVTSSTAGSTRDPDANPAAYFTVSETASGETDRVNDRVSISANDSSYEVAKPVITSADTGPYEVASHML